MTDWDLRFMNLARYIGDWSKDRSKKVGAIIVGPGNEIRSTGYNGFPRGINDDDDLRHESESGEKYCWTEHAERNAIYNAARAGISLVGCRIYIPWFPCMACARAIVQSGISELIALRPNFGDEKWGKDFTRAIKLFEEAKVNVRFLD